MYSPYVNIVNRYAIPPEPGAWEGLPFRLGPGFGDSGLGFGVSGAVGFRN